MKRRHFGTEQSWKQEEAISCPLRQKTPEGSLVEDIVVNDQVAVVCFYKELIFNPVAIYPQRIEVLLRERERTGQALISLYTHY